MEVIYSTKSVFVFIATGFIRFGIIEGFYANISRYPYIAPVIIKSLDRYDGLFSNETLLCSSTIISQYWTVTSGKCLVITTRLEIDKNDMFLKSGAKVWNASKTDKNMQEHNVDNFHILDEEQAIGLIKVVEGFTEHKIKVAPGNYNLAVGSDCEIIGYGAIFNQKTNHLKMIKTTIISMDRCHAVLGNHYDKRIKSTRIFCGIRPRRTNINADICTGDVGGPIVQKGILVGIINNEGCGEKRVSQFIKISVFEKALHLFGLLVQEHMGIEFASS